MLSDTTDAFWQNLWRGGEDNLDTYDQYMIFIWFVCDQKQKFCDIIESVKTTSI